MDYNTFVRNIKTDNKLIRTIKRVANHEVTLFIEHNDNEAYCYHNGSNYLIHLGLLLACDKDTLEQIKSTREIPNDKLDETYLRVIGAAAHEASHVRFTDFNVISDLGDEVLNAKAKVKKLAVDWKKTGNNDLFDDIQKETYKYVYGMFLKDMHNSLEDASIENSCIKVCGKIPFVKAGLYSLRNLVTDYEDEYINIKFDAKVRNTKSYISSVITEIRHMATIGYRNYPCAYTALENYSDKDIEKLNYIALYARFNAKNSQDVFKASKAALKYLQNEIEDIAREYADKYIEMLQNDDLSDEDAQNNFNDMLNQAFGDGENEFAISKESASNSSNTPVQRQSDFELELPSDVQNEIDNADNDDNSGNSDNFDGKNDGNTSNQDDNGVNQGESEENQNNNGLQDSSAEESDENVEENNENAQEHSGIDTTADSSKTLEDIKKEYGSLEKSVSQQELNKALKELEKIKQKKEDNEIKIKVGNRDAKAPSMTENDRAVLNSDMHKGVELNYYSPKQMNLELMKNPSIQSKITPEHKKIARKLGNKLKKILFIDAKVTKIANLNRGRIDKKNLHHIVTDEKCFYNKIDGKVHKARFCILVDQSGSMGGKKAKNAYEATTMLAEACKITKIPLAIYGHDCGSKVNLYHYKEYKSTKKFQYDNLALIKSARYSNHDSIPIYFCLKDLVKNKKQDEKLILLVISDGAPAGKGDYYGYPAMMDIKNIINKFKRIYGIETIGIGIGDDVEHIPTIYDNNCIVPNTDSLGTELLKIFSDIMQK